MQGARQLKRWQPSGRRTEPPTLVVAYCGRGAVVWRAGRLRFAGRRNESRRELEAAVEALLDMEEVDRRSLVAVRDALLTIGGARLLRDPLADDS